tara:strand:- start:2860 stop:3420 length:561 start_codon:yes stop_codon:yes gene_type:complete
MSNLTDFFGGNGQTRKMTVLTSGTSWSVPANLVDGLVSVTMIGGGQAQRYVSISDWTAGQGGSVVTEYLLAVTAGGSVSYAIGAAGTGVIAAAGSSTTFGAITAVGGGITASPYKAVGARGGISTVGSTNGQIGAGKYGCYGRVSGGGGIMLGGTFYGTGGGAGAATAQYQPTAGAIYLQWVEQIA